MSRKDNSKAKNLKNIITTLIEVIIVAAIIFGGLMYVQHRLQLRGTASTQGKGIDSKEETQDEEQNSGTGKYNLVVNIKRMLSLYTRQTRIIMRFLPMSFSVPLEME